MISGIVGRQVSPFHRPRRPSRRVEVQLYSILDLCTRSGEGSASRPSSYLPPGNTRYPFYRRLGGPQGRSGLVRKISPHRDSIPGPSSPQAVAIPTTLPGPQELQVNGLNIQGLIVTIRDNNCTNSSTYSNLKFNSGTFPLYILFKMCSYVQEPCLHHISQNYIK